MCSAQCNAEYISLQDVSQNSFVDESEEKSTISNYELKNFIENDAKVESKIRKKHVFDVGTSFIGDFSMESLQEELLASFKGKR